MTKTNDTLVVGVDIASTKVAAGLVDRNGEIKTHSRTPMVAKGEAGDGLAAVVSAMDLLFTQEAKARALILGMLGIRGLAMTCKIGPFGQAGLLMT